METAIAGLASVSVIVVNYNAGNLLVDCVRSALAQAREVVVVDNASSDSSLEHLESYFAGESRIKTIRNGDNLGFAAACNVGNQYCTEQHILYLNPDCILGVGSLAHMVHTLESNPNAGMVGGLLLDPDGTEQGGGRRAMPTPWRSFVRAFGLSRLSAHWPRLFYDFHLHKQTLPDIPIEVEAISGALMLVRREAMENVGIWDEKYFLHCEDLDWCMRFRNNGWSVLFDGGAPAMHFHGVCSDPRPVFVEWHKHKGMVRFYRKFFRHQYPGMFMWLVISGVWLRFALVTPAKVIKKMGRHVTPSLEQAIRLPAATVVDPASGEGRGKNDGVRSIAVIGASSMVGHALLTILVKSGHHVIAYSRKSRALPNEIQEGVEWREMASLANGSARLPIKEWVWLAPIKVLPRYLNLMKQAGAQHIVAVSTTSRFTKSTSSSVAEREFVAELIAAEESLQRCGQENGITWTVLRPTLIYGLGMDKNVGVIALFIKRFHFFTILGKANGLRQPIHARDVALACASAFERPAANNRAYNISGAELLSYRQMVERIFLRLNMPPRFFSIPLWMFSAGVTVLKLLPPFRTWSSAMAERMNQDMIFDHTEATRDLGLTPQLFLLDKADLPPECH